MRILSIETSCDETAIALLEITGKPEKPEVKVLANNLYSQIKIHEQYGGVYPMLAKREHIKNLPILLEKTLTEASGQVENAELVGTPEERVKSDAISDLVATIDFIAVTHGPGLEPALWTGIEFAKNLGAKWDKPVLPVNHMEGHIFSVLPGLEGGESLRLPALALLISGGHTELVSIPSFGSYEVLGHTLDDATGEAFDKVARMLGLPYPGGPEISRLAEIARNKGLIPSFSLPRPMINSKDLNFSFSGLKTAVLYKLKADARTDEIYKEEMALAFEDAVMEVLVSKTRKALEAHETYSLIIAGGVSASPRVRREFETLVSEFPETTLFVPQQDLSTDNAIMIGVAAYIKAISNPTSLSLSEEIRAKGNLSLVKPS